MEQPVIAVYDANILYPAPLRDLFIRLAQAGLVRARWTDTIHEEWIRNVLKDTRDTSFILWVIMEGLAIGTTRFSTAVLSAFGIGAAFLVLRLRSSIPGAAVPNPSQVPVLWKPRLKWLGCTARPMRMIVS